MSNELTQIVNSYIGRILPQAKKELQYIKDNDWSVIDNVGKRGSVYKVQHLLNDRNIKSAIKLYKMAGEDLDKKRVKSALRILIEFYTILDDRYNVMIEKFDWTSFDLEDAKQAKKATSEVEMQASILENLNTFEATLRAINFGDESDDVNISMHSDTPIPFMMREAIEEQYPEILDHLKKKEEKS